MKDQDLILQNITIKYGELTVYENFSHCFKQNTIHALMGKSGCGKTTLLKGIAQLIDYEGSIIFPYDDKKVSFLFQDMRLLPWLSIEKNIQLVLKNTMTHTESQERTAFYLEKVGLSDKKNKLPKELSGGEQQRAALARSFAFPSNLLLMDEAFQSQDVHLKLQLMELLLQLLEKDPKTVLLVTHDIREAFCLADTLITFSSKPISTCNEKIIQYKNSSLIDNYISPSKELLELEKDFIQKN